MDDPPLGQLGPLPAVSIVIPVRNEIPAIRTSLQSALGQDYSGTLEVVVADGRSDDGTRGELESVAATDDRLVVVDNERLIAAAGLNAAIRVCSGSVIVRCDGRARLPVDYVTRSVELLARTGAANVGGVQRAVGSTFTQRAVAYAMSSRVGVGGARFHYGGHPGPTDTVYLGVFRRDAIEQVGLFNESLVRNQDYELNIRLRQRGWIVYFDPSLQVEYAPRASLRALWRQYLSYGRWKRTVASMYPKAIRLRQLAPPALVLGLMMSAGLLATPWVWPAALVPAAYVGTLAVGTIVEIFKRRDAAVALFPAAVATMHLAWGLGFLRSGHRVSP